MPAAPRNLVNLKDVSKEYASRPILTGITLGVNAGDRIGLVGRNGQGKSTLLRLVAGEEHPDAGSVISTRGLTLELLDQRDTLEPHATVRQELVGDRADHEWAGSAKFREILDELLGGVEISRFPHGLDTLIANLSGGERRRVALARALIDDPELLLLDEPTNHLDVEAVDWLARHLAAREGTLLVVTHDRWFLDAVVEQTWEVDEETVHQFEGGYAAWVLARAERDRQAAARETRRQALIRKELAWLRRGPPARTTKAKFRVDAANELIADEPPPRNDVELLKFATARLGNRVIDAIKVSYGYEGARPLFEQVTWRLAPGERSALVGVNGAGKTTLMKLLGGDIEPTAGSVKRGLTVRVGELGQELEELNGERSVLESLEDSKLVSNLSDGTEITAGMLCDRFGFRGGRSRTLVKDLSGGERRRLQIMRLMMREPNVLLLDEPTNDLDIDTLNALEDLLDSWPGTLIIVSHDRYFVERVTDNVYGLTGDGGLRHLPRGIDQYIEERRSASAHGDEAASWAPAGSGEKSLTPGARLKADRKETRRIEKELRRVERELEKLGAREAALHEEMAEASTDFSRLSPLQKDLGELTAEKQSLEAEWMELADALEARPGPAG
ncbi:MAG: ABC-F family ATP-binding cassette domain-containing protein [Solirubrobacterales bacterium]